MIKLFVFIFFIAILLSTSSMSQGSACLTQEQARNEVVEELKTKNDVNFVNDKLTRADNTSYFFFYDAKNYLNNPRHAFAVLACTREICELGKTSSLQNDLKEYERSGMDASFCN